MSFCFIKLHFKKFINFRVVYSWTHFYHFTFPFVFTMSFLHFFLTSSSQLQSNNSYLFSLMSNFKSLSWIFPFCHIQFYHFLGFLLIRGFPGGSVVKNPPANAGASCRRHGSVWSLDLKDPLEEEMATHSSVLAWEKPWTEKPVRLHSMKSQRVRHDWATEHWSINNIITFHSIHHLS